MNFAQKLAQAIKKNNSLVCVGLDPDFAKLPDAVKQSKTSIFDFNKAIIDATAGLVCVYKPNSAFYEAKGADGIAQLRQTCVYIHEHYPDIPIILDAKRADIGNTNSGYVSYAFEYLGADAITLHPYLGKEALQPFLDQTDKGLIILARTTNEGAGELQDVQVNGKPLYQHVADIVSTRWNANGNCLLVAGAVYPEEMKEMRRIAGPDMIFLVPGVGAQGGDLAATMKAGLGGGSDNLMINSSRGIIFASNGPDFADAARQQALQLRNEINKYR